jgi:hypothetical protein
MKMKQLSRILIVVLFLITSLGVVPGLASPDIDPPSYTIYLPLVLKTSMDSISISGTALDTDAYPIANVTIRDNYGFSAVTDENGDYTLYTQKGENLLTAQNPGFTPPAMVVGIFHRKSLIMQQLIQTTQSSAHHLLLDELVSL